MKTINKHLLILTLSTSTIFSYPPTHTDVLGIWIMRDSPSDKIEFLSNGNVKPYEDNILLYTDTYSITYTCGVTTQSEDLFLKETDEDGTAECYAIMNLNPESLSLMDSNGRFF